MLYENICTLLIMYKIRKKNIYQCLLCLQSSTLWQNYVQTVNAGTCTHKTKYMVDHEKVSSIKYSS